MQTAWRNLFLITLTSSQVVAKKQRRVDVNAAHAHMLSLPKALPIYHRTNKKVDLKYLTCCDLRSPLFEQHDEATERWKQWSLLTASVVSSWRKLIKMKWMKLNQIISAHFLLNVGCDLYRKIIAVKSEDTQKIKLKLWCLPKRHVKDYKLWF